MSDPKAHEVIPQAIVSEVPIEGLPTIQAANLAKEVRKGIEKGNFREGLAKITEVQEVRYEEFPKKTTTFGIEINDNPQSLDYGKIKRTQEEEALLLRMKQFEGLSKKFFERGYDGLEVGEKTMIRAKILEQARRLPQLAPQIERLIAAGQGDAFAERYIKDPAFAAELKNKVNELLEQPFDNDVLIKFEEFMEAKNAADISKEELDEAEAKIATLKARLNSFARTAQGTYAPGATNAELIDQLRLKKPQNLAEIPDYERRVSDAEAKLRKYDSERELSLKNPQSYMGEVTLQSINQRLTQIAEEIKTMYEAPLVRAGVAEASGEYKNKQTLLQEQKRLEGQRLALGTAALPARALVGEGSVDNDIENTTNALNDARRELSQRRAEIEQLTQLEAEEERLESTVSSLQEGRRKLLENYQRAESQKQRSQREYLSAKEARLLDEKTFTEKMDASWGRASNEIISQQMEQAFRIFGEELEGARELSKSEHERAFLTTIQNTYLGPERTRRKGFGPFKRTETYRPLDKSAVLRDYSLLLRQGDVPFVRSLFLRSINPDTNEQFNNDEIDDIFEKNPDLIKKARPEAVKQLLARKVLLGGMTHEDIYIVSTSEWGKDMIQQGLDQNVEFRRAVEQVMGAEALSRHGFADRFKQEMAKHPFWWSLLLGIPAGMKAFSTPPEGEELNRQ